jgi:hypothetical protein
MTTTDWQDRDRVTGPVDRSPIDRVIVVIESEIATLNRDLTPLNNNRRAELHAILTELIEARAGLENAAHD